MKPLRLMIPLCASLFASLCLGAGQDAPPEKFGLGVGRKAPAFALKDQSGAVVTLESLIEKGPVALVFYRSADW